MHTRAGQGRHTGTLKWLVPGPYNSAAGYSGQSRLGRVKGAGASFPAHARTILDYPAWERFPSSDACNG